VAGRLVAVVRIALGLIFAWAFVDKVFGLWIRNVTITTGLVDTSSTPTLLRMLAAGRLDTALFITHRFGLGEMEHAYEVFSQPQRTGALKVALTRS